MYFDATATGRRIQKLRRTRKITQEQLAIELNICDRHMRSLERGEYTPSLDLFVEIAAFFEVTLDYLILGTSTSPRENELHQELAEHRYRIQELIRRLKELLDEVNL